jgi:hypothetical protein
VQELIQNELTARRKHKETLEDTGIVNSFLQELQLLRIKD